MTTLSTIPPHEDILSTFDDLVATGSISFGTYHTIKHDAGGYPLEFRICPAFSRKPNTIGAKLDSAHVGLQKWGPAFNMFCVDRPQFLLLTLDSYRRQFELLDASDFQAALDMLSIPGIGSELYVIFNGGTEAGCSRLHKHLQGLRGPPPAFMNFVTEELRGTVPFRFFAHCFEEGFGGVKGTHVVKVYLALMEQAKEALGLLKSSRVCPHSLFMWNDWLIVIPRRRSGVEGTRASAATAGMLGSVWLSEEGPVKDWVDLGLREVLSELGVPP